MKKFCLIVSALFLWGSLAASQALDPLETLSLSGKIPKNYKLIGEAIISTSNPLCELFNLETRQIAPRQKLMSAKYEEKENETYTLSFNFKPHLGGFCSWKLLPGTDSIHITLAQKATSQMGFLWLGNLIWNSAIALSKNEGAVCVEETQTLMDCAFLSGKKRTGIYIDTAKAELNIQLK